MKTINRMRRISAEDKQLLADLKQIVLGFVPDATLALYGSAARGKRTPESDYDVLVLTECPLSPDEQDTIGCAIYELELSRSVVISEFFVTRDEWSRGLIAVSPFKCEVEREAVLI